NVPLRRAERWASHLPDARVGSRDPRRTQRASSPPKRQSRARLCTTRNVVDDGSTPILLVGPPPAEGSGSPASAAAICFVARFAEPVPCGVRSHRRAGRESLCARPFFGFA